MRRYMIAGLAALALGGASGSVSCRESQDRTPAAIVEQAHSFTGLEGMSAVPRTSNGLPDLEARTMPFYFAMKVSDKLEDTYLGRSSDTGLTESKASMAWIGFITPDSLESLALPYSDEKGRHELEILRNGTAWNDIIQGTSNFRAPDQVEYSRLMIAGRSLNSYLKTGGEDAPTYTTFIPDTLVDAKYNTLLSRLSESDIPTSAYTQGEGEGALKAYIRIHLAAEVMRKERLNEAARQGISPADVDPKFYVVVGSERSVENGDAGVAFTHYELTYQEPGRHPEQRDPTNEGTYY
ncbi:MAG: hypothetical protein ABIH41_00495 [Nanoarchaeota archaeon]